MSKTKHNRGMFKRGIDPRRHHLARRAERSLTTAADRAPGRHSRRRIMSSTKTLTASYTVTGDGLELPRGTRFAVEPGPVEPGRLALIRVGKRLIIGRYYPDIAAIIQPGRLIRGAAGAQVVGAVRA